MFKKNVITISKWVVLKIILLFHVTKGLFNACSLVNLFYFLLFPANQKFREIELFLYTISRVCDFLAPVFY